MSVRRGLLSAFALALVASSACSKRPEECAAVVNVIDDDDQKVAEVASNARSDARSLGPLVADSAAIEDKLAADLGALHVSDPGLAAATEEYRAFAQHLARAARALAAVLTDVAEVERKLDPALADGIERRSEDALAALKLRCGAPHPSPSCLAIESARKSAGASGPSAPADDDYAGQATALEGAARAVDALHVDDPALAAACAAYVAALRDWAALLRQESALGPKLRDAEADISAALREEKPASAHIEALCGR